MPILTPEQGGFCYEVFAVSFSSLRSRWVADLALLATACMWGINIPTVKFAIQGVDGLVFNALRMVFSALTLAFLAWIEWQLGRGDKEGRAEADRSDSADGKGFGERFPWWRIVSFSFLSGLTYPLLFMWGIERSTAANTALLMASMPMWTALMSRWFLHERLKRITWVGLFITLVGTLIVTSAKGQLDFSGTYLWGNFLVLGAAGTWASATVVSRPLMARISPLALAAVSAGVTVPIHLLIVSGEIMEMLPKFADGRMLACLVYSGVFSTGVAYATWNFGVHRLGGSHASVYQNVVTLVAVVVSWLVLRESPLVAQVLGGCLTVVGLIVMRRGR